MHVVRPPTAVSCSRVFSAGPGTTTENTLLVAGEAVSTPLKRPKVSPLEPRSLVSHVEGQSTGISNMVRQPGTTCVFSTQIMDDTNMWIRPADVAIGTDAHAGPVEPPSALEMKLEKEKAARGRNEHLPVFNSVERIYALRDTGGAASLSGKEINSPAQALCQANTETVRRAWRTWSPNTVTGAGTAISAGKPELQQDIADSLWRTLLVTRDNLIVNDCIISQEEASIIPMPEPELDKQVTSPLFNN